VRRVLITDDFPPQVGGVATWSRNVAAAFARSGEEVTVLCRHRPGLVGEGFAVRCIRGRSFVRLGAFWMLQAAGLVRSADRVLVCDGRAARLVSRLVPEDRIDLVFHGSDATAPAAGTERWRGRRWAVSRYLARRLDAVTASVGVLPPPVDPAPRASDLSGPWVMLARATALKGGDRFVRLCAAAGATGLVVGDGPARASWEALARETAADVRFAGALDRAAVADVLATASAAFLLPREGPEGRGTEGLGLALVEAAAAGVPTIGCRTGGVPEALGPGLLLDEPDDAEASARAVSAWWAPARGAEARAWVAATCGSARTVTALST
jgi:glycosyltransferase involved in cell wall biosynthesis